MTNIDQPVKIGFLATIDSPLLNHFIYASLKNGVQDIIVICDSKLTTEKDKRIWRERTGNAFVRRDDGIIADVYSFSKTNIPFYFVDNHNSEDTLALINSLNINCLFNAGTPRKLTSRLITQMKHGIVNVHPGILPDYRGCSAVEWAILHDDKVGNTAHFMDEFYDTGPIITIKSYEFPKNADYQSIRIKVYKDGCELAGKTLYQIQSTGMKPKDALAQDPNTGKFWDPITQKEMEKVLDKIASKSYKYQCLENDA